MCYPPVMRSISWIYYNYTMVSKLALASEILKCYTRARFNVVPHHPLFKR